MPDLALDRREEPAPLPELTLDRGLLRLLHVRLPQVRPAGAHSRPEDLDLPQHLVALVRDAVDGVDARDQLVERSRSEQNLEARVPVGRRVHLHETGLESGLRPAEVRLRDAELPFVLAQVALDRGELRVGEVVRLDGALEIRVEPLDLAEDGLRLRLLGGN